MFVQLGNGLHIQRFLWKLSTNPNLLHSSGQQHAGQHNQSKPQLLTTPIVERIVKLCCLATGQPSTHFWLEFHPLQLEIKDWSKHTSDMGSLHPDS